MESSLPTAYVESVEDIEQFTGLLKPFLSQAEATLYEVQSFADERLQRAEQYLAQCQEDYEAAVANDDANDAQVDQAYAILQEARQHYREVKQCHASITRILARIRDLTCRTGHEATGFLDAKVEQLHGVLACMLEPGSNAETAAVSPPAAATVRQQRSPAPDSMTSVPLPSGYRWVDLSDIALDEDLSDLHGPKDFIKVSYPAMREGLLRFQNRILPMLGQAGAHPSEFFGEQDRRERRSYEAGDQRICDAMLGLEGVYLCRRGSGEKYRIINGRHRIRVAMDLGWPAIPARTKDVQP